MCQSHRHLVKEKTFALKVSVAFDITFNIIFITSKINVPVLNRGLGLRCDVVQLDSIEIVLPNVACRTQFVADFCQYLDNFAQVLPEAFVNRIQIVCNTDSTALHHQTIGLPSTLMSGLMLASNVLKTMVTFSLVLLSISTFLQLIFVLFASTFYICQSIFLFKMK